MDQLQSLSERFEDFRTSNQAQIEQIREQTRLLSIKYFDLPLVTGKAVASALNIGGDTTPAQFPATPGQGYVWHVRRITIEGLTRGATPDVVTLNVAGRVRWELNGNQYNQTWGRGEMRLTAGQIFQYISIGTFNSTATIIVSGCAEEVASEQEGKFR